MPRPGPAGESSRPKERGLWVKFLRLSLRAGLGVVSLLILVETVRVLWGGNFHAVIPGRFYRCSQPSPAWLEQLIRKHDIRTVVNLRGTCPAFDWYLEECRVTEKMDICQEDLCFSAGRLPSVAEVRRLVEVLDRSPAPMLIHCQRGADRTGLVSAVVQLLYNDVSLKEASYQLSLRFGHVPLGRPANLDRFLLFYQEWLQTRGLEHSRACFRDWLQNHYCPGEGRAVLEPLAVPVQVKPGIPFACRVRCRNTSIKPWRLRPGPNAGIHAAFTIFPLQEKGSVPGAREGWPLQGKAGLFEAEVLPGNSIDLTLVIPALYETGRYFLTIDMNDRMQCSFCQLGSEPLEWELEVGQ